MKQERWLGYGMDYWMESRAASETAGSLNIETRSQVLKSNRWRRKYSETRMSSVTNRRTSWKEVHM